MKNTTYSQWCKDISYYGVPTSILSAVSPLFTGDKQKTAKATFGKYPAALASLIPNLQGNVESAGFDAARPDISLCYYIGGEQRVVFIQIPLIEYGQSTLTIVSVSGEIVGKIYELSGNEFILLTLSAQHQEQVYVTGSTAPLGNWDGFNGIPLMFAGGRGGPFWELQVPVLIGQTIEYKFLTPKHDIVGLLDFESGLNRTFTAGNDDAFVSVQL